MDDNLLDILKKIGTEDDVGALSALCAAAKNKKSRQYIIENADFEKVHNALINGAPKARKNAARLLGALGRKEDEQALLSALNSESTRFVRPSIILALGVVGGDEAKEALTSLPKPAARDMSEEKHAREEAEAIRQALMRLIPKEKHEFAGFTKPVSLKLYCHDGFANILVDELDGLGIKSIQRGNNSAVCTVSDFKALYKSRCFYEALFPIGSNLPSDPASLSSKIKKPIVDLLKCSHAGDPPFAYRIECRDIKNRSAFTSSLALTLDGDELINSSSSYEAEIRVTGEGSVDVYCKLFTFPDGRFDYRKNAIPASIAPAAAACIARLAKATNAKRVLDPCCGSGTLLIEYGLLNKSANLTGIDIDARALGFARENITKAKLSAGLVHLDCTRFTAREPYDLVLSNLPFGNRVGNHKENERLYKRLVDMLPGWLSHNGTALLYTMEYTLLKKLLKEQPALRLDYELRTEAGGLAPYVIAVRRK